MTSAPTTEPIGPTEPTELEPPASSRLVGGHAATMLALAAWLAFVVVAAQRGAGLRATAKVRSMPLMAFREASAWTWIPVVAMVGVLLVVALPRACARLGWRRLLAVVALASMGWGIGVASIRGFDGPTAGLTRGVESEHDYAAVVPQVDAIGVGPFIDTYTDPDVLAGYPIHVEGHPVGAPLAFVGLDRVGIDSPGRLAALLIVVGGAIGPAVLVAAREVAGEAFARRAAPFLVLAPSAIWLVTSADALFSAVGSWAIALLVLATAERRPAAATAGLAAAGGALFALGLHLSYGLAPLALVPAILVAARRRWDVVPWAALGAAVVTAAFVGLGFWWFDGLAATHDRYLAGAASRRPGRYFALLGNPAALALAVGPVVAVAVVRVRGLRAWLLPGAATIAVAAADLSGLSKAEVERIWLPFQPWILLLAGGLGLTTVASPPPAHAAAPGARPSGRCSVACLLVLQVAVTLAIEHTVRTPW